MRSRCISLRLYLLKDRRLFFFQASAFAVKFFMYSLSSMTTVGLPDWRAYQEPSVPLEKKTVTGGRGSSLGLGSRDIVSVRSGLSRPYTARSVAL